MNAPCMKDCEGRTVGCHATCEKYKAYKEELARAKKVRDAGRQADSTMFDNHRYCRVRHKSYRQM